MSLVQRLYVQVAEGMSFINLPGLCLEKILRALKGYLHEKIERKIMSLESCISEQKHMMMTSLERLHAGRKKLY